MSSREFRRLEYVWCKMDNLAENFLLAGKRVYVIARENGSFIGRWNGVWDLPIKVADSVHFGVSLDGEEILWLHNYCKCFMSYVSHVERLYELPDGLKISESMFVPERLRAVCWKFTFSSSHERSPPLLFVVNPVVNLMWEVKQAGEAWRERRHLMLYDQEHGLVIVRHHKRPCWLALLGANHKPSLVCLGVESADRLPASSSVPSPLEHCYGGVLLAYRVDSLNEDQLVFVLVGGDATPELLLQEYQEALSNYDRAFESSRLSFLNYMAETLDVEVGVSLVDRAFLNSKINLQLLKHYQRGYGIGYLAGLPYFPIYFGRDTAWTLLGVNAIGDFEASKCSLTLLARYQAPVDGEDNWRVPYFRGEIPHEIRTDGTIIYYSVDATPLFAIALYDYYKWSGDELLVRYLYDNLVKAMDWCMKADRDGDGLVEHGPEGFLPDTQWMDSYYRGKSAVDVQAIFCYAFKCAAEMAETLGDRDRSKMWLSRHRELHSLLLKRYWSDELQFFYDTIRPDGSPDKSLTINPAVLLFFQLADEPRARRVLERFESEDFSTGWGIRTRAKSDPEYDGKSYQKGGVWPFSTGWVAYSEFAYNRFKQGVDRVFEMAEMQRFSPRYFKEVLPGDVHPIEASVEHPLGCFIQAWSAGIFLHSLVRGWLGVKPEAPKRELWICPYVPERHRELSISRLRVGNFMVYAKVFQAEDCLKFKVSGEGSQSLRLHLGAVLPRGEVKGVYLNGTKMDAAVEHVGEYLRVLVDFELQGDMAADVNFHVRKA